MMAWLLVALLALPGTVGPPPTDPAEHVFLQRVDSYVVLHRRLEGPLPREVITADPHELLAPRQALAAAIRAARADARQGDIFSPAVADHFRLLIADALRSEGIHDLLAMVTEHEDAAQVVARVNGDYPAGGPVSFMPPCVLAALPPLPAELQYRFAGRELILWDVHAALIVDFVPRAVPELTE